MRALEAPNSSLKKLSWLSVEPSAGFDEGAPSLIDQATSLPE